MKEIRVPKARFKYNMNPFVQKAKHGATVIVTNGGKDEFEVVPCVSHGMPPGLSKAVDPKLYKGVDMNEPAFPSWEDAG